MEYAVATIKAGHDLIGAVKNAALFACTDDTLPAIAGVDLSWDNGALEVVATDRYMLSRERVESAEVTSDDAGHLFIPRAQVRQLASVKMDASAPLVIDVRDGGATITLPCGSTMVVTAPYEGADFFNWRRLWDQLEADLAEQGAGGQVGAVSAWNPQYLARFAKIRDGRGKPPNVKFTRVGGKFRDLIECGPVRVLAMEVRVAGSS